LLHASRHFAGQLCHHISERRTGQAEHRREDRRQRTAAVEEIADRVGDVLLVATEVAARAKRRRDIEQDIVAAVAQAGRKVTR
jgi:hypothetical protein